MSRNVCPVGAVAKITWSVEHLPNESLSKVMKHFSENLLPSIQSIHLTAADFAKVQSPVLVVHGSRDRQAPYGGGMDWAFLLPNARLVTIDNAAHLPWIESPDEVFDGIRAFLGGHWPETARRITESPAIE